jgi:GTP-binding protein SAR1
MPELKATPIIVFGNKCDRKEALQDKDFRDVMGLQEHLTKGKDAGSPNPSAQHNIEVFMISVKARAGYADGFTWLSAQLA